MSANLKLYLASKIISNSKNSIKVKPIKIKGLIQVVNSKNDNFKMHVPISKLQDCGITCINEILKMSTDDIITKVFLDADKINRNLVFNIKNDIFIRDVLNHINKPDLLPNSKNVIVEFSSPNIAKPFHVGHLRSTIIGNFVSNINKFLGNKVLRLNYLGDWGTQFGLLKVGVQMANLTEEKIRENPLQTLYDAYVQANKLAETDPNIHEKAKNIFNDLEQGFDEEKKFWKMFSTYSMNEMKHIYDRLGVTFDEYHFESMYNAKDIQSILNIVRLEEQRIIKLEQNGVKYATIGNKAVPLIKSDGTMLYLTRDLAAAIDRYKKTQFDEMLYVVDGSQSDHFNNMRNLLYKMDLPWAGRLKHIKFGRIRGMSTRKGNVVFLKDILDEAYELMLENQKNSKTTKAEINDIKTTDILGISSVIVHDLKQRRQKDYYFDWDKVLQVQGDTGIKLQYTHCRLCSLMKTVNIQPAVECKPELLSEPEVMQLVSHLSRFNDVIIRSYNEFEASILVVYLFHLCNHISKALKVLRIKDQNEDLARQRMLLFVVAKDVLSQGMSVLGLQPLEEM